MHLHCKCVQMQAPGRPVQFSVCLPLYASVLSAELTANSTALDILSSSFLVNYTDFLKFHSSQFKT